MPLKQSQVSNQSRIATLKQGIVEKLKEREKEIREQREKLEKELQSQGISEILQNEENSTSRNLKPFETARTTVAENNTRNEENSFMGDTLSSQAKKKQKNFIGNNNMKSVMVIEKGMRHFYVSNAEKIDERNEYLAQRTSRPSMPAQNAYSLCIDRPRINSLSRDLARCKRIQCKHEEMVSIFL